jgi:hypothetical protein
MNSAAVNKEIRAEIRPFLKDAGFSEFTSRTAWRYHADRVDVVNFQSFNSYHAETLYVTTYSFSVNLGCYLLYIPDQNLRAPRAAELSRGTLRPQEYECHLRGRLSRGYFDLRKLDRDIWFIDERGSNITKALHDVRLGLTNTGLPWFTQFETPAQVHSILASKEEEMGSLWGFGRPGSPARRYFLGYTARAAGYAHEARLNLSLAAETPSYAAISARLREDARSAV